MRTPSTKKIRYRDFQIKLYGIGWLAKLVNRMPDSIRRWERLGVLPKPLLNVKSLNQMGYPQRWYSSAELKGYAEIFNRSGVRTKVGIQATNFKRDCATFRAHLNEAMRDDPKILGQVMQEEETLIQVMTKAKAVEWRKKIDHLMPRS